MTENPQAPRPGWYADPDVPGNLRYWDGVAWQQRWKDTVPAGGPRTPQPVGRAFYVLAAATRAGLILNGAVLLVQAAVYGWGLSMFDDALAAGDFDRLDRFDDLDVATSVAYLVVLVLTGTCWAVWQYQLARSARPHELTRSPGWHAWGWFVPVVNLWFPFQNVRDLWRRRFLEAGHGVLRWWWTGWIVALVLDRVYVAMIDSSDTVGDFENLTTVGLVADLIHLVTLVLALRIVTGLTRAEAAVSRAGQPAA